MRPPVPISLIGGYLGAGKTTLINHLIRHAGGRRIGVLVNEFGALPIDEDLILDQSDALISLAGGCICCSFGDNLVGALQDLCALTPRLDHIVVEASGVAIPASIAATISLLADLSLAGIVVLADGENLRRNANDKYMGDTVRRQFSDADLIVVTKSDLITVSQLTEVMTMLADISGGAKCLAIANGQLEPDLIFDFAGTPRAPRALGHGDISFESTTITPTTSVDPEALGQALTAPNNGILRAKGFFDAGDGARCVIQSVGRRFDVTPAPNSTSLGIVCIGLACQLSVGEVKRLCEPTFVGGQS